MNTPIYKALFNSCKEIEVTEPLKTDLPSMLAELEADAAHCRQRIAREGGMHHAD